jgi:Putative S-adenosyl-L-methionine-dependent methyltransferase
MRAAWDTALYGPGGFYRREWPADHFRTSSHVPDPFAAAVCALADEHGADTIVDVGAGSGELLATIRRRDPAIGLVAVDVRPRPRSLPSSVDWRIVSGERGDSAAAVCELATGRTLLIANELLDNVPGEVVELAADGWRVVEVDVERASERLGDLSEPAAANWLARWWPLPDEGQRAVVGLARDEVWTSLCTSIAEGACVAIDFGHVASDRPPTESPRSYRRGRSSRARFDRRHDITAAVAVDSVASAVGGRVERQRDLLRRTASAPPTRPPIDLARSDPAGYLRKLSAVGDWGELTARGALGDFWWIESLRGAALAAPLAMAAAEVASVGQVSR